MAEYQSQSGIIPLFSPQQTNATNQDNQQQNGVVINNDSYSSSGIIGDNGSTGYQQHMYASPSQPTYSETYHSLSNQPSPSSSTSTRPPSDNDFGGGGLSSTYQLLPTDGSNKRQFRSTVPNFQTSTTHGFSNSTQRFTTSSPSQPAMPPQASATQHIASPYQQQQFPQQQQFTQQQQQQQFLQIPSTSSSTTNTTQNLRTTSSLRKSNSYSIFKEAENYDWNQETYLRYRFFELKKDNLHEQLNPSKAYQYLDLTGNGLTDEDMEPILYQLAQLRVPLLYLNVSANQLTGSFLSPLFSFMHQSSSALASLETLDCSLNLMNDAAIDIFIDHFKHHASTSLLSSINLRGNPLTQSKKLYQLATFLPNRANAFEKFLV